MKSLAAVMLFAFPIALFAAKPNPAEYTVKVHVIGAGHRNGLQDLIAVIHGQQAELLAPNASYGGLFPLGDYMAKLVHVPFSEKKHDPYQVYLRYELYLPQTDNVRQFDVIGQGVLIPESNVNAPSQPDVATPPPVDTPPPPPPPAPMLPQ